MANSFLGALASRSRRVPGSGNSFLAASAARSSASRRTSLPQLQQQAAVLEQQVEASGAPGIDEDSPGLFRRLVDVLSRPSYATAGFTEELLNGRSIVSGVGRALSEILSGVGGIQGQKRAFGEVLEGQGVGTKTLADAFPALEGTWVGAMGSRGAAGIALDIATDPLTYMTFGASGGMRVATSKGLRYLNKAGKDAYGNIFRKNMALGRGLMKGTDDVATTRLWDEVTSATEKEFEKLYTVGDDLTKEFLEPGGAKLFGATIPGTDQLGAPLRKAMEMLPESVSRPAIEGAVQMREGMYRMMRGIFSPEGALANLPQPLRERAVRITNSLFRSSTAHRGHLMGQMDPLERVYRKLEKADPKIGERWHDVREGVRPITDITDPSELDAFTKTMALYDSMGGTAYAHGVLNDAQLLPRYIFHQYKNIEDLGQYHPRPGTKLEPGQRAKIEKERIYETVRDAQETSKGLHDQALELLSKGEAARLYPELIPEFDVFKNMRTYIGIHSDSLARKAWREQMVDEFGKDAASLINDYDALYDDVSKLKPKSPPDGGYLDLSDVPRGTSTFKVVGYRGGSTDLTAMSDSAMFGRGVYGGSYGVAEDFVSFRGDKAVIQQLEFDLRNAFDAVGFEIDTTTSSFRKLRSLWLEATGKPPAMFDSIVDGTLGNKATLFENLSSALPPEKITRMFPGANRMNELLREAGYDGVFMRSGGTSGGAEVVAFSPKSVRVVGDGGAPRQFTPENVPLRRAIEPGEVEGQLAEAFGKDGAQYVAVKSALTANEMVYLPKAIAESLESVNSSLFNTKDFKEFGKFLKGFDWLNNNFKWGVYTLWPASAARDGYSNLFLSGLRIGAAAINPARHRDAVLLMAGRGLTREFAGSGYTLGQLRDLSKTFGVWVPGQVFVEQTGRFKLGGARRALTEKRAGIENEARILLWLEEIRRGADPRKAADTVGEFLFNYGEVSRVERELFRRVMPFYTFTRKNVELQWKQLRRNPGMQINQVKPFRGRNDENESMVKFESEAMKLRLDRDGKTVTMLTGIDLPLRNLDTIFRGSARSTARGLAGMITPLNKTTLLEFPAGKELFTDRDMTRTQSGAVGRAIEKFNFPQPIKNWIGYKKEVDDAGRPRYTFDGQRFNLLFRSWMFSRLVSTSDRHFREYSDDPNWSRAFLDFTTGLRVKDLNLDDQQKRRVQFRIKQLEQSLSRRGQLVEYKKRFRPKDIDKAVF